MNLISLDASEPVTNQQWMGLNSPEKTGNWATTGGQVNRADGSLRWGKVGDAWQFRIATDDPPMADLARRCEVLAYNQPGTAIPVNEDFWYAFRFNQSVGGAASDVVCLTQWHQQGGPPLLGLYNSAGILTLTIRHGAGSAAQTVHLWASPTVMSGWQTFVVQARINEPHGMLRVWMNGTLVAQYLGPLGNLNRPTPYAKCGFYWWPADNAWDPSQPDRVLLVSQASIVVGPWGTDEAHALLA